MDRLENFIETDRFRKLNGTNNSEHTNTHTLNLRVTWRGVAYNK